MTTIQQLASNLAAQGMDRFDMISFIYGCQPYASLVEIHEAVAAALAA